MCDVAPLSDLTRLGRIRTLVAAKNTSAPTARLLLFSASGFDRNLTNTATARHDPELMALPRLYSGDGCAPSTRCGMT